MKRDELWTAFIELLEKYAIAMPETDIGSFVAGMAPTPVGSPVDGALQETFHRLFPDDEIGDLRHAYAVLADYVDEELIGWWKIPTARQITDQLRAASNDPHSAAEPVRSWIRSLEES